MCMHLFHYKNYGSVWWRKSRPVNIYICYYHNLRSFSSFHTIFTHIPIFYAYHMHNSCVSHVRRGIDKTASGPVVTKNHRGPHKGPVIKKAFAYHDLCMEVLHHLVVFVRRLRNLHMWPLIAAWPPCHLIYMRGTWLQLMAYLLKWCLPWICACISRESPLYKSGLVNKDSQTSLTLNH